jgi:hypothetical protein
VTASKEAVDGAYAQPVWDLERTSDLELKFSHANVKQIDRIQSSLLGVAAKKAWIGGVQKHEKVLFFFEVFGSKSTHTPSWPGPVTPGQCA